ARAARNAAGSPGSERIVNLSRFFIDRPIFAGVLSVLTFLGGIIALRFLPISEYPEVVPPSVVVTANYPGANPKVIAETVATPLEEQINGVEGMLYMSSQATTDGRMTLTVTFKLGTDPDLAQQKVQNRVAQAEPRLPEEVRRLGVTTVKSAVDLTMVVHLVSPNERYDMTYLRNYALLNVKDRLARINGVGQVLLFGSGDYSMRVWLDPRKVAERSLSANDVVRAIREQNVQAAAGVLGTSPGAEKVDLQLSINAKGRLQPEEEFSHSIFLGPAQFVLATFKSVVHTLFESVALVVLVVILFLQTWRASIIPLVAVPVSIVGTLAFLYLFGFSINALSLFGLVLAIGIVVDDAIVVVENVERNIAAGLSAR